MGVAHFVKPNMVRPGATVIDVGVNRIADASKKSGTRLCGDVQFAEARAQYPRTNPMLHWGMP